jgi:hypothetical protein
MLSHKNIMYLMFYGYKPTPFYDIWSEDWFNTQLPSDDRPPGDCYAEGLEPLKAYLRGETTASDAAKAFILPFEATDSHDQADVLPNIFGLLEDALMQLPSEHTDHLLELLVAIEDLPGYHMIDYQRVCPLQNTVPLWKGLGSFGNMWSDGSQATGVLGWEINDIPEGPMRDGLRKEHVKRAWIEAKMVMKGVGEIPMGWGYETIVNALERERAVLDCEVPAAAEWFVICHKLMLEDVEKGEKPYALKGQTISWERILSWQKRLETLQAQFGIVEQAATKALATLRSVQPPKECDTRSPERPMSDHPSSIQS